MDKLDGDCHRYFGSMPNMSWIIGPGGRVLYKSDWTDTASIRRALEHLLEAKQYRQETKHLASPFRVEKLEYRPLDRGRFLGILEENGPKALNEYLAYKKSVET